MEDERLKGSTTLRGFSGSLPVGEEGIVWSSTIEVDAMARGASVDMNSKFKKIISN